MVRGTFFAGGRGVEDILKRTLFIGLFLLQDGLCVVEREVELLQSFKTISALSSVSRTPADGCEGFPSVRIGLRSPYKEEDCKGEDRQDKNDTSKEQKSFWRRVFNLRKSEKPSPTEKPLSQKALLKEEKRRTRVQEEFQKKIAALQPYQYD